MNLEQFTRNEGQVARRYEYDDATVLAVDFGLEGADASVDLVDGTVIVVVDGAERSSADRSSGDASLEDGEQYEIELPEDVADAHTFMKNGVLTVELEDQQ
jgi:HSP20 family molecular chaperone IbpA